MIIDITNNRQERLFASAIVRDRFWESGDSNTDHFDLFDVDSVLAVYVPAKRTPRMVAAASLRLAVDSDEVLDIDVVELAVNRHDEGCGHGSALIGHVEILGRKLGADAIILTSLVTAITSYDQLGFSRVSEDGHQFRKEI